MKSLDRRIIYLIVLSVATAALVLSVGLPVSPTTYVKTAYKMVDETPAGTPVILSFDYDPSTLAELQPMAKAVMEHAIRKGHKVMCMALWPMGAELANGIFNEMREKHPELQYGRDFVNLGYKAGGSVTIQAMGRDMQKVFPTDKNGTPTKALPIFANIKSFDDIGYVFTFSSGVPGIGEWVVNGHDRYHVKVAGGTTAVSTPEMLVYVNDQQQLTGILGGMKAAAEYETLLGSKGDARKLMDPLSFTQLVIIIFIVMGNIAYFRNRRKEK